jgi:hypothetical protein
MGIFSKKKGATKVAEEEKKEAPAEEKSDSAKKQEDWMNSKWRPAMGWMYMMVCVFDFIVFPIMYTIVQFWETEAANDAFRQWQPLTLAGAGLFHMAMGAVLGLSAWGRTQEKLNGANNGGMQPVSQSVTTTYGSSSGNFGSAPAGNFGANAGGFGGSSPAPSQGGFGQVTTGFGGKPAPVEPPREWI